MTHTHTHTLSLSLFREREDDLMHNVLWIDRLTGGQYYDEIKNVTARNGTGCWNVPTVH